jgi:hypothetical protein
MSAEMQKFSRRVFPSTFPQLELAGQESESSRDCETVARTTDGYGNADYAPSLSEGRPGCRRRSAVMMPLACASPFSTGEIHLSSPVRMSEKGVYVLTEG